MHPSASFIKTVRETARLEFELRKIREKEISRQVPSHFPAMKTLAGDEDVAVRRLVIELLRRAEPPPSMVLFLLERLELEADVKARRRLAAALGKLAGTEQIPRILEAFEREDHRFVKASLALTLGELGFIDWTQAMRQEAKSEGPLAEALRKAIRHTQARKSPATGSILPPVGNYILTLYPGAEIFAVKELAMHGLKGKVLAEPGLVAVAINRPEDTKALTQLRTIIRYGKEEHLPRSSPEQWPGVLAKLAQRIKAENGLSDNHSYRLTLPRTGAKFADKKQLRTCCLAIEKASGWENSPSNYDIHLALVWPEDEPAFLLWRQSDWLSAERAVDREVVPASIHPSLGASLCLLATDFKAAPPSSLVVDPCCGSGTTLSEWAWFQKDSTKLGFDLDAQALAIAKRNLKHVPDAKIARGNMTKLPLDAATVDYMLANLPFGIRLKHGSNRKLYGNFALEADRVMKTNSTLIAYTADYRAFKTAWQELPRAAVETITQLQMHGGMAVTVFRVSFD